MPMQNVGMQKAAEKLQSTLRILLIDRWGHAMIENNARAFIKSLTKNACTIKWLSRVRHAESQS